jgi:Fe-S oxidoreductase
MVNQELIAATVDNCRYCLMCRHLASVELVTHKETLSPHGWGILIASERRGLMEWDEDSVMAIYAAPDHGNSRAHCVTDQPLPEMIAAVRADLVEKKLAPKVVYDLEATFKKWGNPYEEKEPQVSKGKGSVALFVGDEAQYLWPEALDAALKVLAAQDVDPVLIGVGRNNGYMASSLGLPDTAKALAQATLDELKASGAKQMLVLSAGDYFTFRQLYEERLDISWPEDVELLEVTTFLADQLEAGALKLKPSNDETPVAYVDPTLSVRVPSRHEAPRSILAAVYPSSSVELLWRKERAHPVGNSALQFTRPEIAEKLTHHRLQDAQRVGAKVIITEDPGTLHKLSEMADQYNLNVQGLYELLAESLA